ncbi:aspartate beta-hydroxylase domain-containing protein 2 [Plakobranchus ocellatus]|uniref:Aspartate beta-hydroxylase domain-containing protein 2 n=1 Tax=Plakobranchus ocellatus TaxID=259542 RepID=A0AAV4CQA7_9GAST|nr:aspartate beta-hydroxylase domain-containing protein 2 [Plakobranchus ocellatus]
MDASIINFLSIAVFFTAFVLLYKMCKVWLTTGAAANSVSPKLGPHLYTVCESNTCIRCSKNKDILLEALTRLSYHASPSKAPDLKNHDSLGSPKVCDRDTVTSDIKMSLKLLKEKEQSKDPFESPTRKSLTPGHTNPHVFKLSGIRENKFWSLDDFPALNVLEKCFTQIYLEFIHLYKSDLPETLAFWQRNQTDKGRWDILMLVEQGRTTKALEFCPKTMEVLDQIPYLMKGNLFGNAYFSVVHPGTHISAHHGSTNCRVRCHLGLVVPFSVENCTLWVDGDSVHWEEGKFIFFNDAFLHSVEHSGPPSAGYRAVLMLDLWHPDINESQRKILDYAFSN